MNSPLNAVNRGIMAVGSLATVPGGICLLILSLAYPSLSLDEYFPEFATSKPLKMFYTDYETAISTLSTIATASISTLGTVYSIVLVVFTLAAGNIGPRLLKRFTQDRINQATAGLFGGTFLFALTILHRTDQGFIPAFSIGMAFFLATLCVLQLIFFVHHVSRGVTIDEEVAKIGQQLAVSLEQIASENDCDYAADAPESFQYDVNAYRSGYITTIDEEKILALATKYNGFIALVVSGGDFVLEGQTVAQISGELSADQVAVFRKSIVNSVTIGNSRTPGDDVEFSINLLSEIALRALSPGINDTFTAIACIDRLSAALLLVTKLGLKDRLRVDEERIPRFSVPGLTLKELYNSGFHPFRRAAMGNVLALKALADALSRLHDQAGEEASSLLEEHASELMKAIEGHDFEDRDQTFLKSRLKLLKV